MLYWLMFRGAYQAPPTQATMVLKWGIFVETTSAENR